MTVAGEVTARGGEAHLRIMWYKIRSYTTACGCDSEKGQKAPFLDSKNRLTDLYEIELHKLSPRLVANL